MLGKKNKCILLCFVLLSFLPLFTAVCPATETQDLKALVATLKKDPKGPYEKIRWYCPDGENLPADERCSTPGGLQHAALKPEIARLGEAQGIYLGQILAGTDFETFLDPDHYYSRLKQYQIEQYLQGVDDGWILRRARYYRGAVQHENESDWAESFLSFCLSRPDLVASQYFLLRQATAFLPLEGGSGRWREIRAASATLAEHDPLFTDLRVKLHGQPEPGDLDRLRKFENENAARMSDEDRSLLGELIGNLDAVYHTNGADLLGGYLAKLPETLPSRDMLRRLLDSRADSPGASFGPDTWDSLSDLLLQLRIDIEAGTASPRAAGAMLKLSLEVENILFQELSAQGAGSLGELLDRIALLAKACAGSGLIEIWEWRRLADTLTPPAGGEYIDAARLREMADESRRAVQWATSMVRAVYDPAVALFADFEPLAAGFIDDRVRSSLLLPLGTSAGRLQALVAGLGQTAHELPVSVETAGVQGINPGYALGELRVIETSSAKEVFSDRNIYMMRSAPADLKPVAGIATVTEGNLVSHVQLLARNLGIPNAVISEQLLAALAPMNGRSMFYAVSPGGTVVLKPAEAMSERERSLVEKKQRSVERIAVPTDRLDLTRNGPVALSSVGAADSGRICGPKAANLGQLKRIFPEYVGEGIVIPFGVFRAHMDQAMPGQGMSYWQFLEQSFDAAGAMGQGGDASGAEAYILERLAVLRQAIDEMPLMDGFVAALEERFETLLSRRMGELPVFVRSDTNMEDLKDFTGAGLNLTVFNVLERDLILQAIRNVWASPYTERSFLWRQKFLENPENVYPSILILPTVPVETSGVMITADVSHPGRNAVTVAFSRGSGGAVEGQSAESYLIDDSGTYRLLSPAREYAYRVLPETGGVSRAFTSFETAVLGPEEIERLGELADLIRQRMAGSDGIGSTGPFDVELGFYRGDIRLFQIRPYVENREAAASEYLGSLDPQDGETRFVSLGMECPSPQ